MFRRLSARALKVEKNDDFNSSTRSSFAGERNSATGSQSGSQYTVSADDEVQDITDSITSSETRQVFCLRVVVILILIAAATSISVTVFFITRNAEIEECEIQYYGVADKIIQAFQDVMVEISAVSGLAVAASADAAEKNEEWPYITMSNFQQRAGNARTLSGAIYVSINPIVQADQLAAWEEYVQSNASEWIEDGLLFQDVLGVNDFADQEQVDKSWLTEGPVDPLHTFDEDGYPLLAQAEGPFLPRWQTSPVLQTSMVNENLFEKPHVQDLSKQCVDFKAAVLGGFVVAPAGTTASDDPTTSFFATLRSMWEGKQVEYLGDPMSHLTIPIFDTFDTTDRQVVAVLKSTIHWRFYLRNILPSTVNGVMVVVENACDGSFTYEIDGPEAYVVGFGDQHDPKFDEYKVDGVFETEVIEDGTIFGIPLNQEGCPYSFQVYPTQKFYDSFISSDPVIIGLAVGAVFAFTIVMFLTYDRLVERRQRLVLAKATQSTAIVSSLFPKQVRDRLLEVRNEKRKGDALIAPTHKLKNYLSGSEPNQSDDQPIADFFPYCTVFFADIAGFTAWSSTREPAQVFILLQTVYQAFDVLAKRRHVFKVETIGDSYLAVTGLPEPQAQHAVIMAKFAWECLAKIGEITKELEITLGPDTGELNMRFGLHSGPVTAGVLKGDRARFQLFGDTVNTAARMESTGEKGMIQVSQATADILIDSGKANWLVARTDHVNAKGKGVMNTYWLQIGRSTRVGSSTAYSVEGDTSQSTGPEGQFKDHDPKEARLIGWMSDMLLVHIKKVVIVHQRLRKRLVMLNEDLNYQPPDGEICLDEVKDAITMPKFDAKVLDATLDAFEVEVPIDIIDALNDYVSLIAKSYRNNSFHNFEHACHVTMSVNKLLSRVAAPDLAPEDYERLKGDRNEVAEQIHDFTHGITSDPMAVFAMTFAALIHDVDHQGISNTQLAKEEPALGEYYRHKSVAEQNSLDVAWDLLMLDRFDSFRKYVFGTRSELLRFRQLIVNDVLATDIFDKELGALRKSRWNRAFHGEGDLPGNVVSDLRATIVMEHIIQASDVSHTMQHWHVYQKWNRKLFLEMYQAWKDGRLASDPREFWYQGELGFFDNYIIPLTKKLKECNVFGVSSDEYLGYAERNRAEWEERGKQAVAEMIADLDDDDILFPSP